MATKQKDPAAAGKEIKSGASPMGSGSTHRRPRPSTPPGTSVPKDHAKTRVPAKSSSMAGDQKHVPNYLKPTMSSRTDVGKHDAAVISKKQQHSHDDMHHNKPANATTVRRRSLDRPFPQIHKAIHQSSSAKPAAPISLKNSVVKPAASMERVSKVVKAVKSQPPLVKTKSLPKAASFRKDVKPTGGSKKASPSNEEGPIIHTPDVIKSEIEEQEQEESLDINVEEELARTESPGGHDLLPSEKHLELVDEENHTSPAAHVDDANPEKLNFTDEQAYAPEPVAENVKVSDEETQVALNESQRADNEGDQQSNGATDEAPTEGDINKEEDEEIKPPVGLTVKTTSDKVAEGEEQGIQISRGEQEKQSAKSESEISIVHKRQIGRQITKKESPAYNDVIEETASKLVEKRVNKVRALAGAFETVISLEQPHSS